MAAMEINPKQHNKTQRFSIYNANFVAAKVNKKGG
jgi:hypothetical protein